jgi:hypothetical protein
MKVQQYAAIVLIVLCFSSCQKPWPEQFANNLNRLEGEWQEAPGIGYREVWKRAGKNLEGAGYMHAGETYSQTESLEIVVSDSTLAYRAIVPDQNAGRAISFPLSSYSDSTLVFTNPEHDFPNVIAYHFLSDSLLHIEVQSLTDSSGNFSLRLEKNPTR